MRWATGSIAGAPGAMPRTSSPSSCMTRSRCSSAWVTSTHHARRIASSPTRTSGVVRDDDAGRAHDVVTHADPTRVRLHACSSCATRERDDGADRVCAIVALRRLNGRGVTEGIRTPDLRDHNPALSPTELRSPRTRDPAVPSESPWYRAPLSVPHAVARRSDRCRSMGSRATGSGRPGRIRTSDPRIRSPPLCPPELRARACRPYAVRARLGPISTTSDRSWAHHSGGRGERGRRRRGGASRALPWVAPRRPRRLRARRGRRVPAASAPASNGRISPTTGEHSQRGR